MYFKLHLSRINMFDTINLRNLYIKVKRTKESVSQIRSEYFQIPQKMLILED